jgi:hypothetical protein
MPHHTCQCEESRVMSWGTARCSELGVLDGVHLAEAPGSVAVDRVHPKHLHAMARSWRGDAVCF